MEEVGTGTNKIIKWCKEWELPEPEFEETGTSFVLTFRRYYIDESILEKLNERQKKAIEYLKEKGKITNLEYVNLLQGTISGDTALNDLRDIVKKGIISIKRKGRSTYYVIR